MSRIIAGSHGGRRIATPHGDRTRPTTDRVREALFSALASWSGTSALPVAEALRGLAFCDLYAGSGGVGLEAASRGAGPVLLVEAAQRTARLIVGNVRALGLTAEVRTARVEQLVGQPAGVAYDIVFADPPYELATEAIERMLSDLVEHGWVATNGLVVLERSRRSADPTTPPAFSEAWVRRYGETRLLFLAR